MEREEKSYMTRYIVSLFKEIIEKERTLDISYLIFCVCNRMEELYGGAYLESRLEKIGLNTTKDIRDALLEFMSTREGFLRKLGLIEDRADES